VPPRRLVYFRSWRWEQERIREIAFGQGARNPSSVGGDHRQVSTEDRHERKGQQNTMAAPARSNLMPSAIPLGSCIGGVPIKLHMSFFLLLAIEFFNSLRYRQVKQIGLTRGGQLESNSRGR